MSRNILITGVSQGLGLATARAVVNAGWTVYGVSRRHSDEFAALASSNPGRVHFYPFDLGNVEGVRTEVFGKFVPLTIPLHGFVNNAAVAYVDLVSNLNGEKLRAMYSVNVFAPMMIVKQAIRNGLFHRQPVAIVHVSSISAHTGYKGLAMYASTKGALEAFSRNTAREWGARGIRSNAVVAGLMETGMSEGLTEERRQRIFRRTSLNAATQPASVAQTVVFLLSDGAASITGQNIFVDSGTI
jgi:3-oxoacyl-[acyl-carrier protein] reductase